MGYNTIHFLEYSEEHFAYRMIDEMIQLDDPIDKLVFDATNEAVCYMICQKMKCPPKVMMNQIDPITRVRIPLDTSGQDSVNHTILALYNYQVHPIVTDQDQDD